MNRPSRRAYSLPTAREREITLIPRIGHISHLRAFDDVVVRDVLAEHWRRILRLRDGQINESRGVGGISNGCC